MACTCCRFSAWVGFPFLPATCLGRSPFLWNFWVLGTWVLPADACRYLQVPLGADYTATCHLPLGACLPAACLPHCLPAAVLEHLEISGLRRTLHVLPAFLPDGHGA